jgi:hypothetical protein
VITFNVDDFLEEKLLIKEKLTNIQVITQSHQSQANDRIPVYHLHGFLPRKPTREAIKSIDHRNTKDMIVFSDSSYWEMVSAPCALSNVVFQNALHDSHCIFLGCSMTDLNIIRWLAVRHNEVLNSKRELSRKLKTQNNYHDNLKRHYWIDGNIDELRIAWLKLRGVRTIGVDNNELVGEMLKKVFDI